MNSLSPLIVHILILIFLITFSEVRAARILGIIPTPSISHQVVFRPLWKELSLRGHEVVVLTTDPMNDASLKNLTEIDLHFSYDLYNNKHNFTDKINKLSAKPLQMLDAIITVNADICNEQLKHPDVKKLIEADDGHFDVILIEILQPCMFAFAHRFQAPFIGVVSMDAQTAAYDSVGNPTHPVLNPDFMLPIAGKLSFAEKLLSFLYSTAMRLYGYLYILPLNDKVIQENFGEDYPPCLHYLDYLDMLFVNVHPLLYGIRPNVPAVVNIGAGIHIQPPNPLPKALQTFLDDSKNGVIYFSLGTNVKSKDISENTRNIIIETFAELSFSVLWKFESDDLPNKSKNVKILKWLPQQDILRHPNVKLFITQGGLQSIEESIFSHVPMVGIPFYADQIGNVKKMVLKDIAVMVDHNRLTKESFKTSILEVIENPKYRQNIQQLAELLKDEPMTGLERAVWWTEYVIRHKGAQHYKSPAVDMPLYEYFMLDVIGFLLLLVLIITYISLKICKFILKYLLKLCRGRKQKLKHN